eukprot:TRINITY_DN4954_c0_g1_i1.p1 TRINITY_DN4954_c0_g1~~TRINITY_DN4954_c0_g1_i1.p1  ORF type:complete len:181 (-),score=20.70 TRINITY_DN4954_c0_g1_i1:70-612(-)
MINDSESDAIALAETNRKANIDNLKRPLLANDNANNNNNTGGRAPDYFMIEEGSSFHSDSNLDDRRERGLSKSLAYESKTPTQKPTTYYNNSLLRAQSFVDPRTAGGSFSKGSILKNRTESMRRSSSMRIDSLGNEIKDGGKMHKVTFNEQLQLVNEVESWKTYNSDMSEPTPTCRCTLI